MIRRLALFACIFTLCVTAASAFIRHTQAGLGCEPWPQCQPLPTLTGAGGEAGAAKPAAATRPEGDAVFVARALHRLSAVIVGLLALAIALFGWTRLGAGDRAAAAFALADTVFLSWLGRYTPHDLPLVTVGNVIGGFALAAAFGWIAAGGARHLRRDPPARGLAVLAWSALALAGLQSALGVMIGARRAVGACAQALCVPQSAVDLSVFDPRVVMAVAGAADGQALHLVHRLVAISIAACVVWMIVRTRRGGRVAGSGRPRALAAWALASVVLLAPLGLATASGLSGVASGTLHNVLAGAACVFLAALARISGVGDGIDSH